MNIKNAVAHSLNLCITRQICATAMAIQYQTILEENSVAMDCRPIAILEMKNSQANFLQNDIHAMKNALNPEFNLSDGGYQDAATEQSK